MSAADKLNSFRWIPLKHNRKDPAHIGWQNQATTNIKKIEAWRSKGYNLGIATGQGLLVLDFDVGENKRGLESLEMMDMMGLPTSLRVRTPSGGFHVYLEVPVDFGITVGVKCLEGFPGVDIRCEGGLVVGPGSVIDGVEYVVTEENYLALLPDWLTEAIKVGAPRRRESQSADPLIDLDLPHSVKKATDYLTHHAPEAIQDAGGDQTTYKVAARVRDEGVSEEMCFDLMSTHWNEAGKASPPWEPRELEQKIANAYAYATGQPGAQSGLAEFGPVDIQQKKKTKWCVPTDFWAADSEPPDLAPGLVPDLIERFATDSGRRLGVEPGGVAALAVTAFSSLIHASNVIQVRQKDTKWTERPILWTMLIGKPGSNKSSTLSYAIEPVNQIEKQWQRDYARKLAVVSDRPMMALGKNAPKVSGSTAQKPKRRRKIIKDATTESVAAILSENDGGLLLVADELTGFLGGMDAYRVKGQKDRPFWLQAKDGGSYAVDRKNSDTIIVPRLAVSIVGGIQPKKIDALAAKMKDDGLLQRFWPVTLKRVGNGQDEFPDEELDIAINLLAASIVDAPSGRRYRFTAEADVERAKIEETINVELQRAEHHGAFAEFVNKLPAAFARLALAFHFIEWYSDEFSDLIADEPPEFIAQGTARRARLFLTKFVLGHARSFYRRHVEHGEFETDAHWIAGFILSRELDTISERDIYRANSSLKGQEKRSQRCAAMYELEMEGWAKATKRGRDGQPTHWEINPSVHDGRFREIAHQEKNRRAQVQEEITAEAVRQRAKKD